MSGRSTAREFIAALALAALAGCQKAPAVGPRVGSAQKIGGPQIAITAAVVSASGQVVVTYELTKDGDPVTGAGAVALDPAFTLAALGREPVSQLPAWRSLLLTGSETLASLPVAGPGTPAGPTTVLQASPQPGPDVGGTAADLGGGKFSYTFSGAVQSFGRAETLRVGAFLRGATGSPLTTSTLDFVPAGGAPASRELVRDEDCAACHGVLRAHGGSRHGTRICVTCHTYQHADAETVDPAALALLATGAATPQTNPNPLELGRLVHRIHRGKNLPTLFNSSSTALAPPLGTGALPLPFSTSRNAAVPGRKFSVVGEHSAERVFGQIVQRTDNGQPPRTLPRGVTFPRDYRDCGACHANAADASAALASEISRRSCQGCHPDVWFGDGTPDVAHFAHPGGPKADDTGCAVCHVSQPGKPASYVDVTEVHVPVITSLRMNRPVLNIVEVRNMRPGLSPTVVFTLSDRDGLLGSLQAPVPLNDATSPLLRNQISYFEITFAGPAAPEFRSYGASLPVSEQIPLTLLADASGQFTYTFNATLPGSASGTWLVGMDVRRSGTTTFYDPVANKFSWPFTGESVTEPADTAVVWVDVAAGGTSGGSPQPRREIVDIAKCDRCHLRLAYHGGMRTRIEYCVACHNPERTEWHDRPKGADGNTSLASTWDDIEERIIHFRVMIHRIHTGGRTGSAELSALGTYASYGKAVRFRDVGEFPGDLADCTLCHIGTTYRPESVPLDYPVTIANETASIWHAGTTAHAPGEPSLTAVTAACTSCHDTATALSHAASHAPGGAEQCASCNGLTGSMSVNRVHGIPYDLP